MSSMFFAMIGCFLAGLGGRDQLLVAKLAERFGRSRMLLATAITISVISAVLAASAGAWLSGQMSESAARMFIALALFMAAIELAWPIRPLSLGEPTRSIGAIAVVLLARQITDGPRFLICAIAAATASPDLAALGGAIGGGAALAMGWIAADELGARLPMNAIRRGLAAVVLVLALLIGLNARGIIG